MLTAEAIAKEVLFPYLEKDPGFQKEPEGIWNLLLQGLLAYEQDLKPFFAAIYSLNLNDPEKIFQWLPEIYRRFLEGLAEQYVLGNIDVIREFPWLQKGMFREKVEYFVDFKSAIARVERESMVMDLPNAYAALSEEISEEELRRIMIKTEREGLKEKFTKWDREMEEEEEKFTLSNINHSMNYSYSFPKYLKEEKEESLLLPEKATPPERSVPSSLVWFALILGLILLIFLLWLLS